MYVKKSLATTIPAGCKGTKNSSSRQVNSKISAEITRKFFSLGVKLTDFVSSDGKMSFFGVTHGSRSHCPYCGKPSSRIHSRYVRTLQCSEFLSSASSLSLTVRRFYCVNDSCVHQTFSEPLSIARAFSRMSAEVEKRVVYESLNQSARLARETLSRQHISVSESKCIRTARSRGESNPEITTSGRVAIDDFAYRKGHSYMSAIIDLDTTRPVAVFDCRYGGEIVQWFKSHPEISLVSRDGSRRYASIISEGAPQAAQVTDRFHLIKNLKENVVDGIKDMMSVRKLLLPYPYPSVTEAYESIMQDIYNMGDARHRGKVRRYLEARRLQEIGKDMRQIGDIIGRRPQKVRLLIETKLEKLFSNDQMEAMAAAGELAQNIGRKCMTLKTLQKRMEGRLSPILVAKCTSALRNKYADLRKQTREANGKLRQKAVKLKKNEIWNFIKNGQTDNVRLMAIGRTHPEVATVRELSTEFINMIMAKDKAITVEIWIKKALDTKCARLRSYAMYIKEDIKAVKMARDTIYSNGPMEGTVNKIKLIKRTMFNRANVNMLRTKIIGANYGFST